MGEGEVGESGGVHTARGGGVGGWRREICRERRVNSRWQWTSSPNEKERKQWLKGWQQGRNQGGLTGGHGCWASGKTAHVLGFMLRASSCVVYST